MTDPESPPESQQDAAPPAFDQAFRARLTDLMRWRRDVRRFRTEPLPDGMLERLVSAACLAPSVGLSQPWRFVAVESPERRQAVIEDFTRCNREALESYSGERAATYARLKLAGLKEAPCHLAVFADEATETGHGLGRRTMPEMLRYSAVTAICNLWLMARAEGVGVGWVSILDPARVGEVLQAPASWTLIGYLCLGFPECESDRPELEAQGWERRRPSESFLLRR
jgi:5,6-dimethylbenzimidazole synthase